MQKAYERDLEREAQAVVRAVTGADLREVVVGEQK
jgi:hypothetical protein